MAPSSKDTQIIQRPKLKKSYESRPQLDRVTWLIEKGEEPRRIFNAILEAATFDTPAKEAALYLPTAQHSVAVEIVAQTPNFNAQDLQPEIATTMSFPEPTPAQSQGYNRKDDYYHFDVICLGAPIGCLTVETDEPLDQEAIHFIRALTHHVSVTYERQKLSNTLQHFLDRLEVLNSLNQLIASNVGLDRIVKSLARESAFRFSADIALMFLLTDDGEELTVRGGYGCAPNLVPKRLSSSEGILGQVMRLGGHLSISQLETHKDHRLDFLEALDVHAVDTCCLEVRGETLGAIIIGFKRENAMAPNDLTRFEEFCQGAAVAISNANTQDKITAYTERLEELVEQRTADLAFQSARAEEANKAKSRFLANMSHELRTPLTAIVGYSSVLIDGVFGALSEKQTDALNAVVRSSEHLKKLIDDVLNLARIESGKEEARPEAVNVADLLTQTHKIMMQQAMGKDVKLHDLELVGQVAQANIYADAKHVHQILINLMSNAIKYTPGGGEVRLAARQAGDKIQIEVHDTGVGLTPQKMERLFERFERGEDTYSREQEGTGIGLNLTKRLIELNGGHINVESEFGVGSTFYVLLPLTAETSESKTRTCDMQNDSIRLDGLSTVIVDDNHDTCQVLMHILESVGATVRMAHSAKDGLSLVESEVPDIVLTDLAMPGESGLVLIDNLRKGKENFGTLPIIVLSACAFERDRDAALEAGASTFIPKPFKPSEVIQTVRQLTLAMAMQGE